MRAEGSVGKELVCKHEDPSLDPQKPPAGKGQIALTCKVGAPKERWEAETGRSQKITGQYARGLLSYMREQGLASKVVIRQTDRHTHIVEHTHQRFCKKTF